MVDVAFVVIIPVEDGAGVDFVDIVIITVEAGTGVELGVIVIFPVEVGIGVELGVIVIFPVEVVSIAINVAVSGSVVGVVVINGIARVRLAKPIAKSNANNR